MYDTGTDKRLKGVSLTPHGHWTNGSPISTCFISVLALAFVLALNTSHLFATAQFSHSVCSMRSLQYSARIYTLSASQEFPIFHITLLKLVQTLSPTQSLYPLLYQDCQRTIDQHSTFLICVFVYLHCLDVNSYDDTVCVLFCE